MESRPEVIVVSHRLPIKWEKTGPVKSDGGLVSVLESCGISDRALWMGYAGTRSAQSSLKLPNQLGSYDNLFEIPLDEKVHSSFYNGYCNGVLWPGFHGRLDLVRHDEADWGNYKEVNQVFAQAVIENTPQSSPVWIHDYHLMLVPEIIKRIQPKRKVGFFLHIPWPETSIAQKIPFLKEIALALRSADNLCFHTKHYGDNFRDFLLMSQQQNEHSIHSLTRKIHCTPVGIDSSQFVSHRKARKRAREDHVKIIGVDRFDYSKGIDIKLLAFHDFLELNPQLRGSTQLHQLLIPTREDIPEYKKYQYEVLELSKYINQKFGSKDWTPVQLTIGHLNKEELIEFYRDGDICLVTSQMDGMNLVSMEYLSAQDSQRPGVLILSDCTGAANFLKHCLHFKSCNVEDLVRALFTAFRMPTTERNERIRMDMTWIKSNSARNYAFKNLELLGVNIDKLQVREYYNSVV